MAMQNKIKAFDAGMDLATAQILLSQGCFVIWRDIEDKHPDFVYKKERDLAKELPEEVVIEKLIKTIKILLGFERYQHIHYLLSIFDLSEKGRLSLMDVISADKRIKTHPDVERAYNEIHGFHFNLQEAECHIAPFPLMCDKSMLTPSGSISTNTGIAPTSSTGSSVCPQLNAGTITSSSFPMPKVLSIATIPVVAELTAMTLFSGNQSKSSINLSI